jgi:phosphatidylinositol alpha-mannosyltransferase
VPARVREAVAGADVVHVHEPLMPLASLAATRSGPAPVVGTFHADPGRVIRTLYRVVAPVLRRTVHRLRVVTAVSPTAAGAVSRLARVRIVPNAVDVAGYRNDGSLRTGGRVLFIGRDERRKGLDVLLDAWPAVRREHRGASLRVVGGLREAAPAGVEFLGRVDETAKRRELAAARVLAAPNLGGESFGIVLVEGMAAGATVVASDLDAFRAVVGDSGVLVPPGDAAALAEAIASLLADPERAARLGESGIRRAAAYDWPGVVDAYLEAYREALEAGD